MSAKCDRNMSETGDEVQLNLKWDNFSSHLALSFDSCYESQQFVDVSLVCRDGEVIKGHKVILANTSKFFRRLLTENDHPHPMIVMHNIDADDLRSLMTFMYCGEVQVFQNDLKKLLEIADTLEISGLQQIRGLEGPEPCRPTEAATDIRPLDLPTRPMDEADLEPVSDDRNKPASKLLKYVSSLGKKSSENPAGNFESSSKKLQEMARKFEEYSATWPALDLQSRNGRPSPEEISQSEALQPSGDACLVDLEFKSSSRKLREMAKLLENTDHPPPVTDLTETPKKRCSDSDETIESPPKKQNPIAGSSNSTETEGGNEQRSSRTCDVLVKDEIEIDCGSTEVDAECSPCENPLGSEHPGTSMLAAELLKAVANKRKAVENALAENSSGLVGVFPDQTFYKSISSRSRDRKLAFHEPRPCETCNRVYRDAATLRQHTFTMHTAGTHYCGCGAYFYTKYELLMHKKQSHF